MAIKMPEYDGKVHISTGVYWGFLVAYLGYYSTFLSFTVWVLIHTYYTQPTYQTIINALASTFYDRVIAPNLEKIVNELASSGVTDFITGAVLFVITALKSILRPSKTREGGAKSKASIFRSSKATSVDTTIVPTTLPVPQQSPEEIVQGVLDDISMPTSGPHPPVDDPRSASDLTQPGAPTPRDSPRSGVVPGLKEVDVPISPQIHQLGTPIGVPVLRPPVPPKIKIASLR